MKAWFRGQPTDNPGVSPYDLALTQGVAAFEMTRSFKGVHFELLAHIKRLGESCRMLGIPLKYGPEQLAEACVAVSTAQEFETDDEHRLMIVASPGAPEMYASVASPEPWVMITDTPLRDTVKGTGAQFKGATAAISRVRQVPSDCIPASAKHRSRLHFHLAQAQSPGNWAIMLDQDGLVTECPGANLVGVYQGHVIPITHNCLPGISQKFAVGIAESLGHPVSHGKTSIRDFLHCDEIWVTGTPFCALPITKVHGTKFTRPAPGPVYTQVLREWSKRVGVDIQAQIEGWDG